MSRSHVVTAMPTLRLALSLACALAVTSLSAQERIVTGTPPPEIRTLVDAFIDSFNSGSADEWEAMAQAHFTPALLGRSTPAERASRYQALRGDLGDIDVNDIRRRGPDAPLELMAESAKGPNATFALSLEGFKISGLGIDIGGGGAQETDGPPLPPLPISGSMTPAALTAALDGYLTGLAADDRFSGVVLIAKEGAPVYERAIGYADRANRIVNTPATRFNLGSINKSFTNVAVRQLVSAGKLTMATAIADLFPDYPQTASRPATVEQLLNHSAGVADFFGPAFESAPKSRFRSNNDYFALVSQQSPRFAPGARREYCNGCYIVLGAMIEKASGVPYEQYVAEHVWMPAGMKATGYPPTDAIVPNVALGYTRRDDGNWRSNILMRGAAGSAAGGGYATAADLLAYSNALQAGRLLSSGAGGPGGGMGIAGGAPGINAILESGDVWTVIVLANIDPPAAEQLGVELMRALRR